MAENEISEDQEKLKRGLVKVLECVATISSAAAVINPIFGVAGSLIRVVLHHVDDKDIQKLKREFGSVNRALDEISQQNQNVLLQIRKETVDDLYGRVEENIRNQFSKFMDTVEVSAAHEQRKKEFEMSFVINQCDQNLYTLYGGVMGESKIFSQPILDVYMKHSQGDLRVMENLCTRLTYLFCIGLIALMSYAAIAGDDEEALRIEWEEKMKDVAKKMLEVLNSYEWYTSCDLFHNFSFTYISMLSVYLACHCPSNCCLESFIYSCSCLSVLKQCLATTLSNLLTIPTVFCKYWDF